jgi:hypothetical protein
VGVHRLAITMVVDVAFASALLLHISTSTRTEISSHTGIDSARVVEVNKNNQEEQIRSLPLHLLSHASWSELASIEWAFANVNTESSVY